MKKKFPGKVIFFALLYFVTSCSKQDAGNNIENERGAVWLSGGLAYCAVQIHLDNGKKLIAAPEDINSFKTSDRVVVKFREININSFCPPAINAEIIDIKPE